MSGRDRYLRLMWWCFFTGTTERVCLIMGGVEAVKRVHCFIMEKIREKPDPNPKPDETNKNFERHRQVNTVPLLGVLHCEHLWKTP